jgi:hypothetical protein
VQHIKLEMCFVAADRVPLFNAPHLPAPPLPPENITTEQDRQTQLHYEQWLSHQNQIVSSQLKYYETEVSKLRKMRKVSCFLVLSWVWWQN